MPFADEAAHNIVPSDDIPQTRRLVVPQSTAIQSGAFIFSIYHSCQIEA
jgi:hypothetical protein